MHTYSIRAEALRESCSWCITGEEFKAAAKLQEEMECNNGEDDFRSGFDMERMLDIAKLQQTLESTPQTSTSKSR